MGLLGSTLLAKLWARIVTCYRVVVYCCVDWALHRSIGATHSSVCVKNASRSTLCMAGSDGLVLTEPGGCGWVSHSLENPHSIAIEEAIEKKKVASPARS